MSRKFSTPDDDVWHDAEPRPERDVTEGIRTIEVEHAPEDSEPKRPSWDPDFSFDVDDEQADDVLDAVRYARYAAEDDPEPRSFDGGRESGASIDVCTLLPDMRLARVTTSEGGVTLNATEVRELADRLDMLADRLEAIDAAGRQREGE